MLTQVPASLGYPAGVAPGFDPTHPAALGCECSIIVISAPFNILTGLAGTLVGTAPASTIAGQIGPCVGGRNGAFTDGYTFGSSAKFTTTSSLTLAAIFYVPNAANEYYAFGTNSGNGGRSVATFGGSILYATPFAGGGLTSSMPLVAGRPYFVAGSNNGTTTSNMVVTDLSSGKTILNTGSTSAAIAGTTTYEFSNRGSHSGAVVSCAMSAPGLYLSFANLAQWAADPWSFWYSGYDFLDPSTDLVGFQTAWADNDPLKLPSAYLRRRGGGASRQMYAPPFVPIPPTPPPPSTGQFTVSGYAVYNRFPTKGVVYTYAPITRRTN